MLDSVLVAFEELSVVSLCFVFVLLLFVFISVISLPFVAVMVVFPDWFVGFSSGCLTGTLRVICVGLRVVSVATAFIDEVGEISWRVLYSGV